MSCPTAANSHRKPQAQARAQLPPQTPAQAQAPTPFSRRSNRSARISSPEISAPRNRSRHHSTERAASASFRPGASRPSPSSRRRQQQQRLQLSDLHAPARLHLARFGSPIWKSLIRTAGLRLAAIRLAAVLAELYFWLQFDAELDFVIRNHRREHHCLGSARIHRSKLTKGAAQAAPLLFRSTE